MNTQRIPRTLLPLLALVPLAACVDDGLGDEGDFVEFRAGTPASDDPLPQAVLDDINALLPENQDATVNQPQLFPANFDPNPEVVSADTDVWVTFAQEGATYQSALGYFTYPVGQPPASLTAQELEDGLLFANASEVGSGGNLYNGVRMHLGTFQPGVQIGFYLVQNGYCSDPGVGSCSSVGVDFSKTIYTTVDAMNPEYATDPSLARHVVLADLLNDPAGDARLLSFEDQGRLGSPDDDFNDVVFRVTASPALTVPGDEPSVPAECPGGHGNVYRVIHSSYGGVQIRDYSRVWSQSGSFSVANNGSQRGVPAGHCRNWGLDQNVMMTDGAVARTVAGGTVNGQLVDPGTGVALNCSNDIGTISTVALVEECVPPPPALPNCVGIYNVTHSVYGGGQIRNYTRVKSMSGSFGVSGNGVALGADGTECAGYGLNVNALVTDGAAAKAADGCYGNGYPVVENSLLTLNCANDFGTITSVSYVEIVCEEP